MSGAATTRVAVITGAASGIGRATALLFADRGAAVVAGDVDEAGLAQTLACCPTPERLATLRADARSDADARALVAEAERRFGGLDVVVPVAGISGGATVDATSDEEWEAVVGVSLGGTFLLCRAAIPALRRRGGGAIVTVGSILGRQALAGATVYGAAKAAIEMLTAGMAIDHGREGIRANCVLPGSTDTAMMWDGVEPERLDEVRRLVAEEQPVGRFAQPVEIARVIWFLASDEASFVNGASVCVDGGMSTKSAATY